MSLCLSHAQGTIAAAAAYVKFHGVNSFELTRCE